MKKSVLQAGIKFYRENNSYVRDLIAGLYPGDEVEIVSENPQDWDPGNWIWFLRSDDYLEWSMDQIESNSNF